jgi:hypothetical protein
MKTIRAAAVLFLALTLPRSVMAGSAGAEPFNFLFLDANARAVALGGAYTALATDANALLYNPAGLGRIDSCQATFMHNQYFQDITQEYLAYVSPQGWGMNLNYLDFGNVRNTTIANKTGAGLGNVGLTDLAFSAGYGHALSDHLSAGAGVKFVQETIDAIVGRGFGLDLGLLYSVPGLHGLSLAAAVQNIGPSVKFQSAQEKMPLDLRAGTAYAFKAFGQNSVVSADVTRERSEDALFGIGLETVLAGSFPVRLGYNTRNDDGPGFTAGFGYSRTGFSVDYAFVPSRTLGVTHRFSATLFWGKGGARPSHATRFATKYNAPSGLRKATQK